MYYNIVHESGLGENQLFITPVSAARLCRARLHAFGRATSVHFIVLHSVSLLFNVAEKMQQESLEQKLKALSFLRRDL
jgi:hypothetical protein